MALQERTRLVEAGFQAEPAGPAPDGTAELGDRVADAVARTSAAVAAAWERLASSPAASDPEPRDLIRILAGQEGGKQLRARLAIAAYLGMGGDDPAVCDAIGPADIRADEGAAKRRPIGF